MTTQFLSPLNSTACLDRLSAGLVTHLEQSGMPLPEDECVLDYIKSAMRFGNMRALLAERQGEASGAIAWRVEADAGFVVLYYVLPDAPPETAGALLAEVMRDLAGAHVPRGIYAELPDVPSAIRDAFARAGFVGVERAIMQYSLRQPGAPVVLPQGYHLTAWDDDCPEAAASVMYHANLGTLDAMIIPELQTYAGAVRIVDLSVRGRYGIFDRSGSAVVRDAAGTVVGVTLVTRRHGEMGFTAEICVLPDHRRRGIARAMMLHTHRALLQDGLTLNTLGVTTGNPARNLYETLGYTPLGSVWTYVWPRPADWPFS